MRVQSGLTKANLITVAGPLNKVAGIVSASKRPPFDFVVADEAQDMGIPHLRLLAALGAGRRNALFFAGDLGQRIFQQAFSWRSLGDKPSRALMRLAVVEVQHPAQPRPARNLVARPFLARRAQRPLDQLATKPLMKALPMVVGQEFLNDVPEMSLAKKDEVIQALVPDRFDKPLRMRVAVRASRGA